MMHAALDEVVCVLGAPATRSAKHETFSADAHTAGDDRWMLGRMLTGAYMWLVDSWNLAAAYIEFHGPSSQSEHESEIRGQLSSLVQ